MALRIQYASNLMLPFRTNKYIHSIIKPSAPYLALLGNIGRPECKQTRDFFKWASSEFKTIYWVPGSLEYSSHIDDKKSWIESGQNLYTFCKEMGLLNVFVCQKQDFIFPGTDIRVLATPQRFTHVAPMKCYIWDMMHVTRTITYEDNMNMYIHEYTWLKIQLDRIEKPTIVFSHTCLNPLLKYNHVLANLYGTNWKDVPASVTGGCHPWIGLNMAGHKGFIPDAVLELDKMDAYGNGIRGKSA
jgi:hypothetical protein